MKAGPLVSILIPTFNRSMYLEQAINSALCQSYDNIEIIVSDNASSDDTRQVLEKFSGFQSVKLFFNENNIGMVNNWRKMLYEYVSGDWFVILSDDDYFVDFDYIKDAVALADENNLSLVYSGGFIKDETQNTLLPFSAFNRNPCQDGNALISELNKNSPQPFLLCNVLFNTKLAIDENVFQNEFNIGCDGELFLISVLSGSVGYIDRSVCVYRRHGTNLVLQNLRQFELFINNIDCVLKPYEFLKTEGRSEVERKRYDDQVLLPFLRSHILVCAIYFNSSLGELVSQIKVRLDEKTYNRLFISFPFWLKFSLYKRFPSLYLKVKGKF